MLWETVRKSPLGSGAWQEHHSRCYFQHLSSFSVAHGLGFQSQSSHTSKTKVSSSYAVQSKRPRLRRRLCVVASPAIEPVNGGKGKPSKASTVDTEPSFVRNHSKATNTSSLKVQPGYQGKPSRAREAASDEVSPPELVPVVIDPWRASRKTQGSGNVNGSSGGGRGKGKGARGRQQEQQGVVQHRHELRWRMQQCKACTELHALLVEEQQLLQPTDVAFAWHLAARRGYFQVQTPLQPAGLVQALHVLLTQLAMDHLPSMGPVGLSTTAWACAISQLPCQRLMGAICKRAEERLYVFRPRELCALLWACAEVSPADNRLLRGCLRLLERGMSLDLFTPHDLSVLVWCCGKVEYHPTALLEAATQQSVATAATFDAPSAARLMHGYALLQYRPPGLVAPLTTHCMGIMHTFTAQDLSLLTSSLGRLLCDPDQPFMQAAAIRGVELMPDMAPEQLTHLVWGFARLGHTRMLRTFLPRLGTQVLIRIEQYRGELLGPLLWALAKLQYTPQAAVLEGILAFLSKEIGHQTPSTLATVMWSLGTMEAQAPSGIGGSPFFRTFLDASLRQLSASGRQLSADDAPGVLVGLASIRVRPPEPLLRSLTLGCIRASDSLPGDSLARIAWAAAVLDIRDSKLLGAVVSAVGGQHLLPQSIAQLAWSLASLNCAAEGLLASMARSLAALVLPLHGADPILPFDKARILWAYAHLGVLHPPMMGRLLGGLKGQELQRMGPTGVAAVVWACAKLGYHKGPLIKLAGGYVSDHVQDFSMQQLLQLGWSLNKLGCQDQALLASISRQHEVLVNKCPAAVNESYGEHLRPQPPS